MLKLTQQEEKKLKRLANILDNGEVGILQELNDLEDKVDTLTITKKGDKGDSGIKGETGNKGDSYFLSPKDKLDIASKIKVPVVEKIIEKNIEIIKEQPIEIIKEVAIPETPEAIRDKLESLKGDNRLSADAIKGLEDLFKVIERNFNGRLQMIPGGITGRDLFKDIDISPQLDGVTKTFNLQAIWNIISVDLSSFPYGSLRKGIDYTYTPTSVTFTDQIDASTQLQTGQSCVLTVVLS